jgi:putative transposase
MQIKQTYRFVKRRFARNDARVRAAVYAKYGKLQRCRVGWILNNASSSIVKEAGERRLAIVMEDLRGIRKLYRRGNGQGNNYRATLNSWSYYELQRQIDKAKWKGIPVLYVTAWGTNAKCSMCGSKTFPNEDRTLFCPRCKKTVDRDVNAARNILAKGVLRFGTNGPPGEAMVAERGRKEVSNPNPHSRWGEERPSMMNASER